MAWITRGIRQSTVDLWTTQRKPIMVRGDWKHPHAPTEPKKFWLPFDTLRVEVVKLMNGTCPQCGECVRVNRKTK